jgi:hypothetical protein
MPLQLRIAFLLFIFPLLAWPEAETATVTFTLDFPTSQPEHYSIRVQSDGSSHYESSGLISADSDVSDSFDFPFSLSAETRQKIFDLAAKANYFQKDVDSHRKGLASTGKKTLSYKDARRTGESTYNYSNSAAIETLTHVMQSLSTTLEFGHRLQYFLQYQKLALEEELKRMEELARDNQLSEIGAIQPILDQIAADPSVINVSRARAQRLLEHIHSTSR